MQTRQKFENEKGQLVTACKQYSPAAGATQGYIAYTPTVINKA